MMRRASSFVIWLFLCAPCWATTYYVDSTAGVCTGNYSIASRNCSGSDGNSYATIGAAENAATQPGDIVYIRSGTYNETVTCGYSGSAGGGYITFAAYPGDTQPVVRQFLIGSRDYIRIIGLEFTHVNTTYGNMIDIGDGSDHIEILNNYFHDGYGDGPLVTVGNYAASYITVRGNTFYYGGHVSGVSSPGNSPAIGGNISYLLFEGNTIRRCGDFITVSGNHNIFRNNYLYDFEPSYWTASGSATSTTSVSVGTGTKTLTVDTGLSTSIWRGSDSGYTTTFMAYYDSSNKMGGTLKNYNSITGELSLNVDDTLGSGTYETWTIDVYQLHPDGWQGCGGACANYGNIVHDANIISNFETELLGGPNGHIYIARETSGDVASDVIFRNNVGSNISSGNQTGSVDYTYIYNNTFYKIADGIYSGSSLWYFADEGNDTVGAIFKNNLIHTLGEKSTTGTNTITTNGASSAPTVANQLCYNVRATTGGDCDSTNDPLLTSPGSLDFTMAAGSPARYLGAPLTLANGDGSSAVALVVDDSRYFIDGYGIAEGDKIKIGSGDTVRIASVNSATSITLAEARSWSDNDPIVLASMLDASSPDVGALPYQSDYTLTATYSLSSGTVTVTPNNTALVRGVVLYENNIPRSTDYDSPYTFSDVGSGTLRVEVLRLYVSTEPIVLASLDSDTAPTLSALSPSGAQSCTSDPRNVTESLTSSEAATCRAHDTETTWAGMGAGAQMTGAGTTSHSRTVSRACGASYSPNVLCQDAAANESAMGEWAYSIIARSTAWGHETGVTEPTTQAFLGQWTGTGAVSGSGDSEKLSLQPGQYMQSPVIPTGASKHVSLSQNKYASGDAVTMKYRTGATSEACEAAEWSVYSGEFVSSGYVQIRVESTL